MAIVAAVGVVTTNVGLFKVEGDGMQPAIEAGDLLLFSRHNAAAGLRRGAIVAYRPSPNTASGLEFEISVGRILAMPGDDLSIDRGCYRVNGIPTKTPVASLNGLQPAVKPPDYPRQHYRSRWQLLCRGRSHR